VLGEREVQNRCVLRLSIFGDVAGNPSVRRKRCPVTPCVPARRDGRYMNSVLQNLAHLPKFCNWIVQHNDPTLGADWPCRPQDPNRRLPSNQEKDPAILAMGPGINQCVACLMKAFIIEYWSNTNVNLPSSHPTVAPLQAMAIRWFCQVPNAQPKSIPQQPGETDAAYITRKLVNETVSQRTDRVTKARGYQDSDEFLIRLLGAIQESIATT
jgi:hypothetical protein